MDLDRRSQRPGRDQWSYEEEKRWPLPGLRAKTYMDMSERPTGNRIQRPVTSYTQLFYTQAGMLFLSTGIYPQAYLTKSVSFDVRFVFCGIGAQNAGGNSSAEYKAASRDMDRLYKQIAVCSKQSYWSVSVMRASSSPQELLRCVCSYVCSASGVDRNNQDLLVTAIELSDEQNRVVDSSSRGTHPVVYPWRTLTSCGGPFITGNTSCCISLEIIDILWWTLHHGEHILLYIPGDH
ncbi:hypothetical protein P7K49_005512 [Saguinus oedipus]|uniref:Uncharacterized protein n=1 Tax=Saguinus oedipus TaxID=9490 RepID=A0ABQ9VZR8_SAGOE|nr:hypothetical protein P7K49_005512 [Saguinus oedipus]